MDMLQQSHVMSHVATGLADLFLAEPNVLASDWFNVPLTWISQSLHWQRRPGTPQSQTMWVTCKQHTPQPHALPGFSAVREGLTHYDVADAICSASCLD
jgi:hypothetical protein